MTTDEWVERSTRGPQTGGPRPSRAPGVRLLGRYEGSGFRDERFLVERADRQMVLLTKLLYLIVEHADGHASTDLLADRVSRAYGQRLVPDDLVRLIHDKLGPSGLVALWNGAPVGQRRADPLLALSVRGVLLPTTAVRLIGRLLAPLFHRPVILAIVAAVIAFDVWVVTTLAPADVFAALIDPTGVIAVLLLLLAATLFHEFGHAAGCSYGGARPGQIGVGIYLWIPAFYTNVTNAYRLDRAGRLRTDLGGVYFNAVFIVVAAAAYLWSGWAPLLAVIALSHLEIVQQLLPVVRFDGYYILGDLAGVPNLFGHVRPIMRSLLPGPAKDPRVAQFRLRPRVIVTAWVLVTVPALVIGLGVLMWNAPKYLAGFWDRADALLASTRALASAGEMGAAILSVLSLLAITLPVVGLSLVLGRAVLQVLRAVRARRNTVTATPPAGEEPMSTAYNPKRINGIESGMTATAPPPATSVEEPGAAAFTEERMLRRRTTAPRQGWRHGLYVATSGRVNVGPSAAERREQERIERVRTPLQGPRRVVTLSRKGGAGKTTTTLMLGHTLAVHRGDRVVALDANPDAGSLVYRVRRQTPATVTTLLGERELITKYADLRAYTSQAPTRLEVIASDDDPSISQALGDRDYRAAIDLLTQHYNLILIDTGTGILDSAVQGILREADQIVVVMPPALDGARVAAGTLDWLDQHGHADLVASAVAVINTTRGRQRWLQLDEIEKHFASRCAGTVRIPWDPALESGAATDLADLRPATRDAYLELAETVAGGFAAERWPGR
ncbi:putative peptide zinc metalloprotease protein [Kribbella amoyensis]|uniref:Putative peptide zinc metalloprotease protein n=1 Tax=Kribbella amoyensis TaxID=996641 RepID=A0A561B124_9ACTN|nr:MinD/ParA family protein [Kribbella amoyensis]TWD72542.1 putative peptide zinc metalloprotease protein [Kribbella amoyensis]